MGAFYIIKYFGRAGAGGGTLYIGRGVVVGTDIQGAKFDGTYQVTGGRMRGVELVEALIALERRGAEIVVCEQSPALNEIGAGLKPHALGSGAGALHRIRSCGRGCAFSKLADR